jgi:DNA (cytosine-5)-methyltransferase 1
MRIIDLFAGLGGIRKGVELALEERDVPHECVFTSEIKSHAITVLRQNHPDEEIHGDITQIESEDIPDFDILCAGFPCQAFSYAGKRLGFEDTRGTLFFDVERIIKDKRPRGFILENVEGLVSHDKGKTFRVIINHLRRLNYHVSYRILNAKDFGIPQDRKRIYIVGSLYEEPNLDDFPTIHNTLSSILEKGQPLSKTKFTRLLLSRYSVEELYGKSIKDKRGGDDNIHSWDLGIKGRVTIRQKQLLNAMLRERRKKKWAERYGIEWMDGMPLTTEFIQEFFEDRHLQEMLDDLVEKGYLTYEHPKKVVLEPVRHREQDESLPKGYNIVAGKLSFEVNKILDPNSIAPTLVAMDMQKLYVPDGDGIRKLTIREGLSLFGYPNDFNMDLPVKEAFDLLGNTVAVPVIKAVAERLLDTFND